MECSPFMHLICGFCDVCRPIERREEPECPHARITVRKLQGFHDQRGCLDCDKWLDPVKLNGERTF